MKSTASTGLHISAIYSTRRSLPRTNASSWKLEDEVRSGKQGDSHPALAPPIVASSCSRSSMWRRIHALPCSVFNDLFCVCELVGSALLRAFDPYSWTYR